MAHGIDSSVRPGISAGPFLTMTRWRTEMWREMMQPRTPLRYRSPFLMPYSRQPCTPAYGRERGGVSAAGCGRRGLQGPELTAAACETACAPCPASSRLSAACSTLAVPNPGSATWVCRPGTGLGLHAGCSLRAHCRPWVASCARRRCLPRIPRKRRSYELDHYRQSRLPVCPYRATTGSDPSAADCRPRCRWPLPC